jgi:hypothetical protein
LNPRWYFQRYVAQLPARGEIALFDRSWYNRTGVEHVMGFCTEEEYREFLRSWPLFEEMLVRAGIYLIKYWFLGQRRGAGTALLGANAQSDQALEAQPDGSRDARLNCIAHLLRQIPYHDMTPLEIEVPPRQEDTGYKRPKKSNQRFVPEVY